eukprot:CAMPEP_0176240242 /NCGR_PEP_ID=MMETSP0121_2-20121125/29274_1 /TAXON_ID=160619 /ORGANISM="Kryptoperidinium foliaceum, Strain CCMP 1326" /LENGTH=275 /DNA_ID=CAMNT_0017579731 /DNA_START=119 /DNA_END=943 /DNA_ORIENTATION=+
MQLASEHGYNVDDQQALSPEGVATLAVGAMGTTTYRRFFHDNARGIISPWHDIPLHTGPDTPFEKWMVTEIPKMTSAKYEAATSERWNPIAQDLRKGRPRHYHGPIFWNYGFLPQTWEDPDVLHEELRVRGDNDPLDVVEIGGRAHRQGEVSRVRILGVLAMIDSGELDWKVIAVDTADPLADVIHDIGDLEEWFPHVVTEFGVSLVQGAGRLLERVRLRWQAVGPGGGLACRGEDARGVGTPSLWQRARQRLVDRPPQKVKWAHVGDVWEASSG